MSNFAGFPSRSQISFAGRLEEIWLARDDAVCGHCLNRWQHQWLAIIVVQN